MDYEKKYNEALSQARFYYGNCPTEPEKKKLEKLFPELRESEDERIRKRIRLCLDECVHSDIIRDYERDECLAYLEKHKEPTTADGWDYADKRMSHPLYLDGFEAGRAVEREMSEKEQKPIPDWMPKFLDELRSKKNYFDWDEHRDIEGHILAIINWIAPDYFKRKEEQKPAEKQDYSGLNDSERAIHRGFLVAGVENVPVGIIKETAKECIANFPWPTKWSEEDENKLYQVMETLLADKTVALRDNPHGKALHEAYDEMLAWLKSLRPSWKPSEEQMEALMNGLRILPPGENNDILLSLYNDLKKL